jgi:DNA-binding CsgD family transcriptional regulator
MEIFVRHVSNAGVGDPHLNAPKKARAPRAAKALPATRAGRRPVADPDEVAGTLATASNWHAIEVTPTTWMLLLPEGPSQTVFEKAFASRTTLNLTKQQQDKLYDILQEAVEAGPNPKHPNACREALTPRQLQIAKMISVGASNKVIARALNLTVGTVKVHLHRMYKVLGISSRVELAILVASE